MQNIVKGLDPILGLITHMDEVEVPLGGALQFTNVVQYTPGRIQRIPGVTALTPLLNGYTIVRHSFRYNYQGTDYTIGVISNGTIAKIWNFTNHAEVVGPVALTDTKPGPTANVWTSTPYFGTYFIGNGVQNGIYMINPFQYGDTGDTSTGVAFSSMPSGNLLKSYFGRMYVSGIKSDPTKIYFPDSLTMNYSPLTNYLTTDEVNGEVVALSINSPTSSVNTLQGELIAFKQGGILKLIGDPAASASGVRDIVSTTIYCESGSTVANTPIGTIFVGKAGIRRSVYYLPLGTGGEPQDIGEALQGILNDPENPIVNPHLASAVFHDGFYKLIVNFNGSYIELWMNLREYIRTRSQNPVTGLTQGIVWYGPHDRGVLYAPVVVDNSELHFFGVNGSSVAYEFKENISRESGFTGTDGQPLSMVLDMPLNVEPMDDEKLYDIFNVFFAKESYFSGSTVDIAIYKNGVLESTTANQPVQSISNTGMQIKVVDNEDIPISSRTARVVLSQNTSQRMDILKMEIQYLAYDKQRIRS